MLPGVERMVKDGCTTGGATKNRLFLGDRIEFEAGLPDWVPALVFDPQTSGGLAVFSRGPISGSTRIGQVVPGEPRILVKS